eukprot:CAMPEP_0119311978 /NCGR_PEP_ID=MMETSP1333-20130426/24595_1 /TAXON_ID=418940 /ORGANISM="Scyphosphaera apsteinii, Strain RCC1455" /LENGTH=63 /DNA_ID=CAMNT_0007316499 /DNA_START=74 /DNA_END=262 /DNA_ORIENTATION=+
MSKIKPFAPVCMVLALMLISGSHHGCYGVVEHAELMQAMRKLDAAATVQRPRVEQKGGKGGPR